MNSSTRFGLLFSVLLAGNLAIRFLPHGQAVSPRQSLERLPMQIGKWTGHDLPALNDRAKQVLDADDYVSRFYERDPVSAGVFIAYYRSQKSGDALHSPKNCLPGAGWEPVFSEILRIPRAGGAGSLDLNHYVVQKDGVQQDVFYWYQAGGRTFASEYWGKAFLVWSALVRNRTDGALVRLTTLRSPRYPSGEAATLELAGDLDSLLGQYLPE